MALFYGETTIGPGGMAMVFKGRQPLHGQTIHRSGVQSPCITDVLISLLTDLPQLSLNGLNSIIGRGVVVHAGRDDMGRVRQITNFYFYFSLCDMHVFKEILRAEMMAV